jgi:hypothetical protein
MVADAERESRPEDIMRCDRVLDALDEIGVRPPDMKLPEAYQCRYEDSFALAARSRADGGSRRALPLWTGAGG